VLRCNDEETVPGTRGPASREATWEGGRTRVVGLTRTTTEPNTGWSPASRGNFHNDLVLNDVLESIEEVLRFVLRSVDQLPDVH
jgi:hypothetical protein